MKDFYTSISQESEGIFKDRGSKFFASAHPAETEEQVHALLSNSRKKHPKARHHCYAFRLGEKGELSRFNDDGEPSGTAGKPILGQLVKQDLTNTVIIVVRYFGGTKLGVGGLIQAYKSAAADALENAQTRQSMISDYYQLEMDYAKGSKIHDEATKLNCKVIEQNFGEQIEVILALPRSVAEESLLILLKRLTGLDFETVEGYKHGTDIKISRMSTSDIDQR